MDDNILSGLIGQTVEGVDYDIEDCILTFHMNDETHWMFQLMDDGSLAISIAEGLH